MTTAHHTPITSGAAADAATFNAPLAQLDAAIEAIDFTYSAKPSEFLNGEGIFAVPVGTGDVNGHTLQDDAVDLTQRAKLNFVGGGMKLTDAVAGTKLTIPGYVRENSSQLLYVGVAAYSVLPGAMTVNGEGLVWASNIARTSLSLAANTLYNIYLYNNSGTPAVEESTTAPVWDTALECFKKTGDDTRRWIGFLETNASSQIRRFLNTVAGRTSEIIYLDGDTTGRIPVNSGTSPSSWTSFSLAPLVPIIATHVLLLPRLLGLTAGDEVQLGISPIDLGASTAGTTPYVLRAQHAAIGSTMVEPVWVAISAAQTMYYRTSNIVGTTGTATIYIQGAKFVR